MAKIEEYLLYAAQCLFMAEYAPVVDEQAEWCDLAKLWLSRAMETAEAEVVQRDSPEAVSSSNPA